MCFFMKPRRGLALSFWQEIERIDRRVYFLQWKGAADRDQVKYQTNFTNLLSDVRFSVLIVYLSIEPSLKRLQACWRPKHTNDFFRISSNIFVSMAKFNIDLLRSYSTRLYHRNDRKEIRLGLLYIGICEKGILSCSWSLVQYKSRFIIPQLWQGLFSHAH